MTAWTDDTDHFAYGAAEALDDVLAREAAIMDQLHELAAEPVADQSDADWLAEARMWAMLGDRGYLTTASPESAELDNFELGCSK